MTSETYVDGQTTHNADSARLDVVSAKRGSVRILTITAWSDAARWLNAAAFAVRIGPVHPVGSPVPEETGGSAQRRSRCLAVAVAAGSLALPFAR